MRILMVDDMHGVYRLLDSSYAIMRERTMGYITIMRMMRVLYHSMRLAPTNH